MFALKQKKESKTSQSDNNIFTDTHIPAISSNNGDSDVLKNVMSRGCVN